MASGKCVHKGCGKVFADPEEPCVYHPGPPEFHEGQKGGFSCTVGWEVDADFNIKDGNVANPVS